jgi:hypothetical protein
VHSLIHNCGFTTFSGNALVMMLNICNKFGWIALILPGKIVPFSAILNHLMTPMYAVLPVLPSAIGENN